MHVVIAGGGTGGHLFPGLAVAEVAKAMGDRVTFVGTPRGIETSAVPQAGFALELLDVTPLKGRSWLERLMGLGKITMGVVKAHHMLGRLKPDVVIGVGGYASAATVMAAALRGIPILIQEQNSIPGMSNRFLGRLAKRVCITFPESARYFNAQKVIRTGNPVRQTVIAAAPHMGTGQFTIFVFGGSQGARSINQAMLAALPFLKNTNLHVVHQVGKNGDVDQTVAAYKAAGISAEVHRFIQDMGKYYRMADGVVCRAGASTLSELALMGKPAIMIPYPFAADNHQEANARSVVSAGGGRLILDRELDGPRLAAEIKGLLEDRKTWVAMSACMSKLATPNAAQMILQEARGIAHV